MFIGIDLGTSSVKTILIDENQNILATKTEQISIQNPKNGYYGGSVAGPVFAEIANKIYANGIEMHNSIQEHPLVMDYTIPRLGNLSSEDAQMI